MSGATPRPLASLRDRMRRLVESLQLKADDTQLDGLVAHLQLIERWNRVYNLTAVRDTDDMLTLHFADCLAAVAPLQRHIDACAGTSETPIAVLDAGSGAGLPGLVLARMCAGLQVTCVDTVGKKAAFLRQVAAETKLGNVELVHGRVEETPKRSQDLVVARAYASLHDLVRSTHGALRPGGVWLAMKGHVPHPEIQMVSAHVDVFHVEQLAVPGLPAERCLVWMRQR